MLLTCPLPLITQMYIFPLEKCAAEALLGDNILCPEYKVRVPLSYLVPDLLLTDLPSELTVDLSVFEFNPRVRTMYTCSHDVIPYNYCRSTPPYNLLCLQIIYNTCTCNYTEFMSTCCSF